MRTMLSSGVNVADTKLLGEEKNTRAASHQELVKMKDRQGDISCDSTAPVSSL